MKLTRVVLPLALAAILIGGLVARSGLSLSEFASNLRQVSPTAIAGILACTLLFIALSGLKWRMVMSHVASDDARAPGWDFTIYYTALGAVLSLVITPHAAMVVSRSVGTKLHSKGSALTSAAASAYEQMFDVVPLLTMLATALISIVLKTSLGGWLVTAAALNGVALVSLIMVLRTRFWSIVRFVPLPQGRREALRQKLEWFATPAATTLLGARFVITLFATSMARYVVILLRTGLIMTSVGLPVSAFQFLKAYGVARLSTLISITPGELGINEWTWTGVLTLMGCRLDDAARFVLINRVYNTVSLLLAFGLLWLAFTFTHAISLVSKRERAPGC